ncbi:MAG TPA: hypothetical protein VFC65_05800 [Prolixibacteraceae bacterium]|nr:hypothetical protein [Prolixibacteraceae bacterium]
MINNTNFNSQFVSIEIDAEPALKVEDWMTTVNLYNTTEELTARDTNMKVEDWMLENKYFSSKTELRNGHLKLNARETKDGSRGN